MNFACQILKPAFTVIRDQESKCLLVFIRGTRSIKDIVTDALCAPVPFNHSMVSGHAHSGMAASADWIRERCVPLLLEALRQYPHYKIKVFINVTYNALLIKTMQFFIIMIIIIFPYIDRWTLAGWWYCCTLDL